MTEMLVCRVLSGVRLVYQNTVAWCSEDWATSRLLASAVSDDVTASLVINDTSAVAGAAPGAEGEVLASSPNTVRPLKYCSGT